MWPFSNHAVLAISSKIAFRYCCHKQMRISAAASYYRLCDLLERQKQFLNDAIFAREALLGRQLAGGQHSELMTTIDQAKRDLALAENVHPVIAAWQPIEYKRSSAIKSARTLGMSTDEALRSWQVLGFFSERRKKRKYKSGVLTEIAVPQPAATASSSASVTSTIQLEQTTSEVTDEVCYGVPQDAKALPCFRVQLIGRRVLPGVHPTFDISVPGTHNFVATGLTAHNCAPLTSFDWNETDPSIVGTSSIDTTCTIWNVGDAPGQDAADRTRQGSVRPSVCAVDGRVCECGCGRQCADVRPAIVGALDYHIRVARARTAAKAVLEQGTTHLRSLH